MRTYSIREYAQKINKPEVTVRRWIKEGQLEVRRTLGGKPFLTEEDLAKVLVTEEKQYSLKEVAEALGVTQRTITRWVTSGQLVTVQTVGKKYVTESTLEALKRGRE